MQKKDLGLPLVTALFIIAIILGIILFRNYINSEKIVSSALNKLQTEAPKLSIEECAQRNMQWYVKCDAMAQICSDTVPRMMKICIVLGDKAAQCNRYADQVLGYNFGAAQCAPFLKNKNQKRACADTWQVVADFCKSFLKKT